MKLILLDLDDTLLRSDKSISEYTVKMLKRCQSKGILVGFCTARGESNIFPYIRLINPEVIISSSGALVKYKGDIIYSSMFSADEVKNLIDKSFELTDGSCEITVDTLDKYYANYEDLQEYKCNNWGEVTHTDYTNFSEQALKICVNLDNETLAQQVADSVDNCDMVHFTGSNWYKYSKSNATKDCAIKELSKILDIPYSEMIAFGDDYGDIEMLKLCGKGIAMKNAVNEVKNIADELTLSNNDDGVAVYLEKII